MTKYATSGERFRAKKLKKKKSVRISPNPVICLHGGAAITGCYCFSSDKFRAHSECWRAHYGITTS